MRPVAQHSEELVGENLRDLDLIAGDIPNYCRGDCQQCHYEAVSGLRLGAGSPFLPVVMSGSNIGLLNLPCTVYLGTPGATVAES